MPVKVIGRRKKIQVAKKAGWQRKARQKLKGSVILGR
jgi:hypothetical protein